jgi:predicted MFS family arabinose efflux permease
VWTARYALLLAVVTFVFLSHLALLPVIPLYVLELGGTEFTAGVVLGSFSVASFVLRPRLGRLIDRSDAGYVLLWGCVAVTAATFLMLIPAIVALLLANVVRGVAWGGVATATHVVLAGLAPPKRRAEASGYYNLAQALAGAIAPAVALSFLLNGGRVAVVVAACGGCALAAALFALPGRGGVAGASTRRLALQESTAPVTRRQLDKRVDREALLPSVLVGLAMATHPAILGFVPLYAQSIGISIPAVTAFYVASGLSAMLSRALVGRVADRIGPGPIILAGFTFMAIAFAGLLAANSGLMLCCVAVLYSGGQGMTIPALTALAIERSKAERVGAAMATYSAAIQVGFAVGGLASGVLISYVGYWGLYCCMILIAAVGAVITVRRWRELRSSYLR